MESRLAEIDTRRGFLLTDRGRSRFRHAFRDTDGRRKSFYSVIGLDHRTVSKVYNGHEPVHITSLHTCFDTCGLNLEPDDWREFDPVRRQDAPPLALVESDLVSEEPIHDPGAQPPGEPTIFSGLYIPRAADGELSAALQRQDSTILIKGPHQTGKSTLLGRGLSEARKQGARTCCTDLSRLSADALISLDGLCSALCQSVSTRMQTADPEQVWRSHWPAVDNLDAYLREELLRDDAPHLVWALDDLDRLFLCRFREDIFRMFRGWHNARSHEPEGPWNRLTLVLVYSAEATLLISNLDESPFNIATPVELEDLSREDMARLNDVYGDPLSSVAAEDEIFALIGGHPHLARMALRELQPHGINLAELKRQALLDGGIYRSYLDRLRRFIVSDTEQERQVRAVLCGECIIPSPEADRGFHRLRSAGVLVGSCAEEAAFRCELYRVYLARHLA